MPISTPIKRLARHHYGAMVPIVYFLIIVCYVPLGSLHYFHIDEGYNLMKAVLVNDGYKLYTNVWSDQPPLLAWLLALWLRLFGSGPTQGRVLIALIAAAGVGALQGILRMQWGRLCGLIGAFLLPTVLFFFSLSYTVMIGLPSLCFALISAYCLTRYRQRRRWGWLPVSALFLACSVNTKFFTSFLVPITLVCLIQEEWRAPDGTRRKGRNVARPVVIWLVSFSAAFLLVGGWAFVVYPSQLFGAHLAARARIETLTPWAKIGTYMFLDLDLCLFAAAGTAVLVRKQPAKLLYPLLWLVLATTALLNHRPVSHHQYPLIGVPLAWLAAVGTDHLLRWEADFLLRRRRSEHRMADFGFAGLIALIALVAVLLVHYDISHRIPWPHSAEEVRKAREFQLVLAVLEQYEEETDWVLTDVPWAAYVLGMRTPPGFTVLSRKRTLYGQMPLEEFVRLLGKYQPEQILFGLANMLTAEQYMYVHRHYRLNWRHENWRHYLRRDVAPKPLPFGGRSEPPRHWNGEEPKKARRGDDRG